MKSKIFHLSGRGSAHSICTLPLPGITCKVSTVTNTFDTGWSEDTIAITVHSACCNQCKVAFNLWRDSVPPTEFTLPQFHISLTPSSTSRWHLLSPSPSTTSSGRTTAQHHALRLWRRSERGRGKNRRSTRVHRHWVYNQQTYMYAEHGAVKFICLLSECDWTSGHRKLQKKNTHIHRNCE